MTKTLNEFILHSSSKVGIDSVRDRRDPVTAHSLKERR